MINVSPSYLLQKHIDDKIDRLESYKKRDAATEAGIRMMTEDINRLVYILGMIKNIEPAGLMSQIADIVKRNGLLDVDITCLLIPNKLNIPPYQYASAAMYDLTDCKIPDIKSLFDMHAEGKVHVEVDDFTGNNIDNVIKLYANRGDLYNANMRADE